jgi:hypothetical protein
MAYGSCFNNLWFGPRPRRLVCAQHVDSALLGQTTQGYLSTNLLVAAPKNLVILINYLVLMTVATMMFFMSAIA